MVAAETVISSLVALIPIVKSPKSSYAVEYYIPKSNNWKQTIEDVRQALDRMEDTTFSFGDMLVKSRKFDGSGRKNLLIKTGSDYGISEDDFEVERIILYVYH